MKLREAYRRCLLDTAEREALKAVRAARKTQSRVIGMGASAETAAREFRRYHVNLAERIEAYERQVDAWVNAETDDLPKFQPAAGYGDYVGRLLDHVRAPVCSS